MPRIAVGVDAGGSKTAVTYSLDGECQGVWFGGSANATIRGIEAAGNTIAGTIELALDGAFPDAIVLGAAGAGREKIAAGLQEILESRFPQARVEVRDDASIALRAAIPAGDGAVLIAGTGAIAYAEKNGNGFRCGGYGFLLGDGGSGFAIGAAAVDRLLRAYDGRMPRDQFAGRIEHALGVRSRNETLHAVYGAEHPAAAVAQLAALVLELAAEGDRSATKIVQQAAAELFELLRAVIKSSGLSQSGQPVALAGGLLKNASLLTFLLEGRLLHEFPSMPILKETPEPYTGALCAAETLL